MNENNQKSAGTWQIVWELLQKHSFQTSALAGGMIITSFTEGLGIMTLVVAVQVVIGDIDSSSGGVFLKVVEALKWSGIGTDLGPVLAATVVLILLKTLMHFSIMSFGEYLAANIQAEARYRMVQAIMGAEYRFLLEHRIGRFTNALGMESDSVASLFTLICRGTAILVNILVYFSVAMTLSWEISLAALIASVLMAWVFSSLVSISRRTGTATTDLYKSFVTRLTDGLHGIKTLKAMGVESYLGPHLEDEVRELKRQQILQRLAKQLLVDAREPFIIILLSIGMYVAVTKLGTDVALIVGMALVFHRTINSVGQFQSTYQSMVGVIPQYQSFSVLLVEAENSAEVSQKAISDISFNQSLDLDKIRFQHSRSSTCLSDVSLKIPAGDVTVIIGPSGAGKTTLLDLVCGLYEPSKGEMCVDGQRLDRSLIRRWREKIGYVTQESVLFHDSIRNNVTLREQHFTAEQVEGALKKARAWEFVGRLPDGVDQVIGSSGLTLSGGEKQRIALARALIRDPWLLILDEATTALDPVNELKVMEAISDLKGSVTVLAVSHQKALTEIAASVYRLEHGKITLCTTG